MTKKKSRSGIRKKYFTYIAVLLALALLMSSVGVWAFVRKNMTGTTIDKYEFMTEKTGIFLDNLYRKSDEVTAECILNENVQESLQTKALEDSQRGALGKYFAYVDLNYVADYCYIDNKKHVYTRSYSKVTYEDFEKSGFEQMLGEEYARTKWFWTKDTLFGSEKEALFIGRYVRSMEYAHEPGMLFFKMDDSFFSKGIEGKDHTGEGIVTGILDENGQMCAVWSPENMKLGEDTRRSIRKLTERKEYGMVCSGEEISDGYLSAYRQEGGMIVYTFVPNSVLNGGLSQIVLVLMMIYLFVIIVALIATAYFSEKFTKPIQYISEAMTGFDGKDFDSTIELHTNTELDLIGQSYNKMLRNIERLLEEIKEQEKELRTSELNMLISQINPHFLYNTLDTIYMLARINKEETTMRMIQALSKYLRLSLNKGHDIVTVEDELENVKSYMEIQQIRNDNLFSFEIDCRVDGKNVYVLKLILQPLVENAIKYGFCDIYEGGVIRITVEEAEDALVLCVYNNGTPMERHTAERINAFSKGPLGDVKECFPDRKHGYGVANIVTRLRLKYGDDVKFYYETCRDGTSCSIRIPKERTESHEE